MNSENDRGKKLNLLKWAGLIGLLVLLIAAAFVGGQLATGGVEALGQRTEVGYLTAPELPATSPVAVGVFVSRENNSLLIGTGELDFLAGSETDPQASYDGPLVEVVVTHNTIVYRDITSSQAGTTDTPGTVQQKVGEGNIDEISEFGVTTVWGRTVGDRVVADVLLYYQIDPAALYQAIEEKEARSP